MNKILYNITESSDIKDNTLICAGCFNYNLRDDLSDDSKLLEIISTKKDVLSEQLEKEDSPIKWKNEKIYETTEKGSYLIPFLPTCMLNQTSIIKYPDEKETKSCQIPSKYKKKWSTLLNEKKELEKILKNNGHITNNSSKNTPLKRYKTAQTEVLHKLTKDRSTKQCPTGNIKDCSTYLSYNEFNKLDYTKKNNIKWCERILYSNYTDGITVPDKINCTKYSTYDFGQFIATSKHKAVYATFEVEI